MDSYQIEWTRTAGRELRRLPLTIVRRVVLAVDGLALNPRPRGALFVEGSEALWRIRIGTYRVIYEVNDGEHLVVIHHVRHRREAYRDL